jgi:hypothetical protein
MTSAPNRLPQLNGNRRLLYVIIAITLGACSPKLQPVKPPVEQKQPEKPPVTITTPPKPTSPKVSVISMLLPLGLDHIGTGTPYTDESLNEARIAADYYRGFKLALDSLTFFGYNYKLQLYDTRDNPAQSHKLAYDPQIRASDLIIGPVYPGDIKAFTSVLVSARRPIVSPLSPEPPATFHNQNLITINPPLEYHAWCAAQYINDKVKPQKIFVLRSGYSEEMDYLSPFKKALDSLSGGHIKMVTVTIAHGQLKPIIAQLSATKANVFVIPSTDHAFLTVTLHSLDTLMRHYPVTVFGHPSWQHLPFLSPQLLQQLKTHITSADDVDYKSKRLNNFIRDYLNAWHVEPSGFAIKGYDEGMYFGTLLGKDSLKDISQTIFTGMHNNYHFVKKPGMGLVNTHVYLLLYSNFELKQVE